MSRCDCADDRCTCKVVGGEGISVTGIGTPELPITVSLDIGKDDDPGCLQVMDCVGSHTGPGLSYNEVTGDLSVHISNRLGNQLGLAPDGGLYVPMDGIDPTPEGNCRLTLEDLPDFINCGDQGLGAGITPWGHGRSVELAAAAGWDALQAVRMGVSALADGTLVMSSGLDAHYDNITPVETGYRELSEIYLPTYQAYDRDAARWYGFGARNWPLSTLSDIFGYVQDHQVLFIDIAPASTVDALRTVQRLVEMAEHWCMSESLVLIRNAASEDWPVVLEPAATAGLACGVACDSVTVPETEELTAASVGWVFGVWKPWANALSTEKVAELAAAGIRCIAHQVASRVVAEQLREAGWSGINSMDALYTASNGPSPVTKTSWALEGIMPGQTSDLGQRRNYWRNAMGEPFGGGWIIPTNSGLQWDNDCLRLGFLSPLPDPQNWSMTFETMIRQETSGNRSVGILCCCDWDGRAYDPDSADTDFGTEVNGYVIAQYNGGNVNILRVDDGKMTRLASQDMAAIPAGTWTKLRITITPTTITATRYSTTTGWTPLGQVAVDDDNYRGQYMYAVAIRGSYADGTARQYDACVRHFDTNPPTDSALKALAAQSSEEQP